MRIAIVGGGIAGLSAALEARALRPSAEIIVLEASARLGGKVAVSDVGGLAVDEGADSMLTRVPDGLALVRAAGLEGELVSPAAAQACLWSRGELRPLPAGTLLGLPTDLAALARSGLLSRSGLARVPMDLVLRGRPVEDDISVGELVTRRFGREVVDRLVDPLLGGVYAGRADRLSLRATLPQLVPHAARHRSLLKAASQARAATPPTDGPLFASLPRGLGRLPERLAQVAGADVRLGTTVRGLTRTTSGWSLTTGSAAAPARLEADVVVIAVPAAPAARLLGSVIDTTELAALDYASVAIVTLVLDGPTPGRGSGYLVPAVEGRATKAVTFSSRKWAHLAGSRSVVRASVGRHGDVRDLQRDDAELVEAVRAELALAVGPLPRLVDSRVTRWGGGLPQYAVGHLDRVRRTREAVARHPGLAVAGAAYDGVGVPACARSGREAARSAVRHDEGHDRDPS
ncbi:MAG: protoporphyrinogen oxidase [Frankiales bacterium]|jgi:oxygen-dependent protoporphyrinogen oxidase|nr:protoporphyrinogen oxidase [Frankiales bacterium]